MILWSIVFPKKQQNYFQDSCPMVQRTEILTIFCWFCGRNDVFIRLFWFVLTLSTSTEFRVNFKGNSLLIFGRSNFMKDTFWNILTFKGGIEFKAPLMIEQAEELMLMARLGKSLLTTFEKWNVNAIHNFEIFDTVQRCKGRTTGKPKPKLSGSFFSFDSAPITILIGD